MQTIDMGTENKDPDQVIREAWGESLQDHLDAFFDAGTATTGMSRKQLQARLKTITGNEVSLQSIGLWLSGQTAPRPHLQVAVAKALGVPARRLFPLEPM